MDSQGSALSGSRAAPWPFLLAVPALTTAFLFVVLVSLGVWQLHRLAWKQAILAEIALAEQQAPVPLGQDPPAFRKVSVTGLLRYDLAALYGAEVQDTRQGSVLGGELIVPMLRPGSAAVLVDLGWVPDAARRPADAPREALVAGYVRPADRPGWFSATDDVVGRRFYTLDPKAIGAALGLPNVAPFTLVAIGGAPAAGYPLPAEHLPQPSNNHLSYAITWFGLAGALLVIFTTWARKALRA